MRHEGQHLVGTELGESWVCKEVVASSEEIEKSVGLYIVRLTFRNDVNSF